MNPLNETLLYRSLAVGLSRTERTAMRRELQRVADSGMPFDPKRDPLSAFAWYTSPQGDVFWRNHYNRILKMREHDLGLLPNRKGYRFIGVTKRGERINCIIRMNERRQYYVVNEDTGLPCWNNLSHWVDKE